MGNLLSKSSLSGRALAVILPAAVLLFGLLTWFAYSNAHQREIASSIALLKDDASRVKTDMQFRFDEIEHAQLEAIRLLGLEMSANDPIDLDSYLLPHGDGTRRSVDALWEGTFTKRGYAKGFGSFVSSEDLAPDRKAELSAALAALIGVSNGLPVDVSNIYFFTKNNDLVMHAPERPDKLQFYRDTGPADLDFQDEMFMKIIQPDVNPEGRMRCTGLEPIIYDQSRRTWTSGCMTPARIAGKQVGGIGSSIPLELLVGDEKAVAASGTERILVTPDMMLVRHPKFTLQSSRDTESFLDLAAAEDVELKALFNLLSTKSQEGSSYLEGADKYVFVTQLDNPGWFVISAMPGEVVRAGALSAALPVLVSGVLATILFIVVTVFFVRRDIAQPLRKLTAKADSFFGSASVDGGNQSMDLNEVERLDLAIEKMRARVDREHSRITRSYDAVLDTLTKFAVFVAGPGGKIIQASRGAQIIFGEEIAPEVSLSRYLGIDDEDEFRDMLSQSIREGQVDNTEERVRSDGSKFWVALVLRPLWADQAVIGFALILRDVTEEKKAEMELRDARDSAEFEAETRKSLLATVSHEIRTPMTGILGMLEQVKEDNSARSRDRALTVIEGAVDALMRVLDDVLENARAESGKMTIEEREFESSELIRRIFELFAPLAKRKGIKLSIEPGPREQLMGDPARIQQIIANFLSNAIKFSPEGAVNLVCEAREYSGELVTLAISVEDHGIGIEEGKIQKLFEPFEQASDTTKKNFGGTGLGLYICKQLAEAMGGSIEVESEMGVGSTFTLVVELPRASSAANALPGKAKTALIVGGAAMTRLTAEATLEELGFRPKSVSSITEIEGQNEIDIAILHASPADTDELPFEASRVLWVLDPPSEDLSADQINAPLNAEKLREWLMESGS